MEEILREHAMMLRGLADELDNVATVLEGRSVGAVSQGPVDYHPSTPATVGPTLPPMVASPNGRIDITYNAQAPRINRDAILRHAEEDVKKGKTVMIRFVDEVIFLTPEATS